MLEGGSGERIFTLPAGDYNLDVSANAGKTGSAEFRLIDTASATALTFGQPVRSDLTPLRETDLYSFEGTAGETIFYQNLQNQHRRKQKLFTSEIKSIA